MDDETTIRKETANGGVLDKKIRKGNGAFGQKGSGFLGRISTTNQATKLYHYKI